MLIEYQSRVERGLIEVIDQHSTADAFSTHDPSLLPSQSKSGQITSQTWDLFWSQTCQSKENT